MELLMLTCAQFHGKWKVWNNKSKCYTGRNTPRTCTSQCSGTWRTWEVFLPCQHSPLVSTNTPCQHKFLICPLGFVAVQTKEGCGAPHKQELKPPHCPQPGLSTAQPLSVRWAHEPQRCAWMLAHWQLQQLHTSMFQQRNWETISVTEGVQFLRDGGFCALPTLWDVCFCLAGETCPLTSTLGLLRIQILTAQKLPINDLSEITAFPWTLFLCVLFFFLSFPNHVFIGSLEKYQLSCSPAAMLSFKV